MRIVLVVLTMFLSFVSLIGVIVLAKPFGFSPSNFHDPNMVFDPMTMAATLGILLLPIFLVLASQRYLLRVQLTELGLFAPLVRPFFLGTLAGLVLKAIAAGFAYFLSSSASASLAISGADFQNWLPYFLWFLVTLFLNSLNEELAYRAFPLTNIKASGPLQNQALIWSWAILFSLLHFLFEPPDALHFFYRLAFGALAGIVFIESRSLWLIVGLHTGWNFVALSFSDTDWRVGNLIQLSGIDSTVQLTTNIVIPLAAYLGILASTRLTSEKAAKPISRLISK